MSEDVDPLEDMRTKFMLWRSLQFTSGLIFVISGGVTIKKAYDHVHAGMFGTNDLFRYTSLMQFLDLWPVLVASFFAFIIFRSFREGIEEKLMYAEAAQRGEIRP